MGSRAWPAVLAVALASLASASARPAGADLDPGGRGQPGLRYVDESRQDLKYAAGAP